MNWGDIMTYVIAVPLSVVGFYLAVRIASYAICKSIHQVFKPKEKRYEKEKRS
jgi:hypothetical protein